MRPPVRRVLGFAFLSGIVSLTNAEAAGRPTGMTVTVNAISPAGQVDFDVTQQTGTTFPNAQASGLLGNLIYTYIPDTGTLLTPVINAIDYGDGNVIAQDTIPNVGGNVYRGSFSHTYAPGTFTLRAGAAAFVGYTTTAVVTAGNPVVATVGRWRYDTILGGTDTDTFTGSPYVFGITNSVQVDVQGVPTAPPAVLWALALALLAAGAFLLKRGRRPTAS